MSRLIDADAIPYTMLYKEDWLKGTGVEKPGVWKDTIDDQPTVEPERKKGKWLPDNNNFYGMRFVCSACKESETVPTIGFTKYIPIWDYCPNCGADMRGENDD